MTKLSTVIVQADCNSPVSLVFLDSRVYAVRLQGVLKSVDAIGDLILSRLQLFLCDVVVLLRLFQIEFELLAFSVALALLVFLPVLDTFLMPLFHEAGISLKLIYLNAAHFLLAHVGNLSLLSFAAFSKTGLAF